jgi:hypothetical protein
MHTKGLALHQRPMQLRQMVKRDAWIPMMFEMVANIEIASGIVGVTDVAVPIVREVRVLMMRAVELAEAFDRGEGGPHHEEIGEEIVLPTHR